MDKRTTEVKLIEFCISFRLWANETPYIYQNSRLDSDPTLMVQLALQSLEHHRQAFKSAELTVLV